MIETSDLYKLHFAAGSIQEYKVEIDGAEYNSSAIYDKPTVSQRLFDKQTYTVGSFAVSVFKVKLKVPTGNIKRNAIIKFFYRYVGENVGLPSEWVKKFDGKVTKRKEFNKEVTTIEAHDKGANYDIFLDKFPSVITSYPANARTVANLCAGHLGVTIHNINDIFNGNIVEYPNELTVVEVLKNIARSSGGNWTITEDDKLKMVVVKKNTSIAKYSSKSHDGSMEMNPISRVTSYWDDESAFSVGDDTGTELIIDNQWATQESTQYIYNILKGYKYIPSQGNGVYADPAIQLGDVFTYGSLTQLVASVDWTFDGACTAKIDAPMNNEENLDDPYEIINQQQMKRKVSLGDSYQGVTIDRQNGIQMLLSPDGTEQNAIGKWYSDINKGMAFQTREKPTDPWMNWMYFDKNEKTFKLKLYSTTEDTEAMIQFSNQLMNSGSVIGNFNPQDYLGWEGGSRLLYVAEYSKLRYLSGLTYAMGFQPVRMPQSLSEWGLSFFNNGSATSPFGYVVPTEKYSYKAKVQRFKPFSIDLLEFKDMLTPFHKSTRFTFNNPQSHVQFTSNLDSQTAFVRIKFNVTGVTPSDRFEITENMYNRGLPKEYFVSGTEALVYAQSSVTLLNNRITLETEEIKDNMNATNAKVDLFEDTINLNTTRIDGVSGDIHNAGVEINAVEGIITNGKKFEVKSEDKSTTYMKVTDNGIESHKMTAVDMIANNATIQSGKIAGFDINGSNLVGQEISLEPSKIKVGNSSISSYRIVEPAGSIVTWFNGNWFNFGLNGTGQLQLQTNGIPFLAELGPTGMRALDVDIIRPKSNQNGGGNIGTEQKRYGRIFLQNQPNVSSDKNLKYNISNIDEMLLDSFETIKEKSYKTKHDDKHSFGYIAQDVESCLYDYVNKVWDKEEAEKQMNDFKLLSRDSEFMSLLYIEVMIIMQAVERRRNDRLEERLNRLEELLKKEGK